MDLIEIGKTGRPHGVKGEIKLFIEPAYESDVFAAQAILIGDPPVPYFMEGLRGGGSLIARFEGLGNREQVALLSNKAVWLPTEQVTGEPETEEHPFMGLVGYQIQAEGYALLGPILEVMDLPQHYLGRIDVAGREVYIPLHEDLIVEQQVEQQLLIMQLPEGLLD